MSLTQKLQNQIDYLIKRRIKSGGLGNHTHAACIIGEHNKRFFGQNCMRPINSIHAEQHLLKNLVSKRKSCKKRGYSSNKDKNK